MGKEKINLLLVLVAILLLNLFLMIGGVWFFRAKLFSSYFKARAHILELRTIDKQLDFAGELRTLVLEAQDDVASLDNTFFKREDVVSFLELLEKMAVIRDLDIVIHTAEVVDGQKFSARFRFSLKGSFSDIASFITMLENAPYLVQLQELSLNKMGEENVSASLVVQAR